LFDNFHKLFEFMIQNLNKHIFVCNLFNFEATETAGTILECF